MENKSPNQKHSTQLPDEYTEAVGGRGKGEHELNLDRPSAGVGSPGEGRNTTRGESANQGIRTEQGGSAAPINRMKDKRRSI
jgi:hypothetical protein